MTEQLKQFDSEFLSEFPEATVEEWRASVDQFLKGAPFDKKLVTKTLEGIALQPIYWDEQHGANARKVPLPGEQPYTRGTNAEGSEGGSWQISCTFTDPSTTEVNKKWKAEGQRGLDAVSIVVDRATQVGTTSQSDLGIGGTIVGDLGDLKLLLDGAHFPASPLHLEVGTSSLAILCLIKTWLAENGHQIESWAGTINGDPLALLAREGQTPRSLSRLYDELALACRWAGCNAPKLRPTIIDTRPYHNGGANAVQELGIALASGAAHLRELTDRGLELSTVCRGIGFHFAVGSHFFMEIAKLRAARTLWATLVDSCSESTAEDGKAFLLTSTSELTKSKLDPYVNMLRTTTEAFAAALGGCDVLSAGGFDEVFGLPSDFSRRIARNVQVILKEESHIEHVIDPAGGSWLVESVTQELCEQAWSYFQEIEAQGGLPTALKEGWVQSSINECLKKRTELVSQRRHILVGTSMYANLEEKKPEGRTVDLASVRAEASKQLEARLAQRGDIAMPDSLDFADLASVATLSDCITAGATIPEISCALASGDSGGESVEPIALKRLSRVYEELRDRAEAYRKQKGEWPRVFLATMGSASQHKLRTDFSRSFFQPGGFKVLVDRDFETAEEAAKSAASSGAEIVVLCSTDETYPELVPAFVPKVKELNPAAKVVLAGYPKEQIDAFRAAGIDDFIHIRSNNREVLSQFQTEIGA